MEDAIPTTEICLEYDKLKLKCQTAVGTIAIACATAIAIIYDGDTLIPIVGGLMAIAGGVLGITLNGVLGKKTTGG